MIFKSVMWTSFMKVNIISPLLNHNVFKNTNLVERPKICSSWNYIPSEYFSASVIRTGNWDPNCSTTYPGVFTNTWEVEWFKRPVVLLLL